MTWIKLRRPMFAGRGLEPDRQIDPAIALGLNLVPVIRSVFPQAISARRRPSRHDLHPSAFRERGGPQVGLRAHPCQFLATS